MEAPCIGLADMTAEDMGIMPGRQFDMMCIEEYIGRHRSFDIHRIEECIGTHPEFDMRRTEECIEGCIIDRQALVLSWLDFLGGRIEIISFVIESLPPF